MRARAGSRVQAGQALLLMVAALAALLLASLTLYNTGQLALQRLRLDNAVDAAVLSAAVVEARGLNFAASMNRAVIANEAAIAQSVSLRSWSAHLDRLLGNVGLVTRWLPYVGPVAESLRRFWSGFDRVLQPGLAGAEAAHALAIPALATAAETLLSTRAIAAVDMARETLRRNAPEARVTRGGELLLARSAAGVGGFTERFAGARRIRQRDVILASLDPFTRQRNRRLSPPIAGALVRFEKRGGTELLGFDEWRAVDTFSLHARSVGLVGRWRERAPLGWGAAAQGSPVRATGRFGGSARVNPRATRLASTAARGFGRYRGVEALRDLSPTRADAALRRRWSVRVVADAETLGLSGTRLSVVRLRSLDGTAIAAQPSLPGGGLYATGAAEVEFVRREARGDRRSERPNLFNPYWRARLVRPTGADQALARAADGTPDPLAGLVP